MRREATTLPLPEQAKNPSAYETISCMQDAICHLQEVAAQNERVGLVTITFQFEREGRKSLSIRSTQSIHHLLESLRPLVRKTDSVLQLEHTCYFLLRGADQRGANIVQERLWEALLWAIHNITDKEFRRPCSIETGHSVYSGSSTTAEQSLHAAHEPILRFVLQEEKGGAALQEQKREPSSFARQSGIPYLPHLPHKLPSRIQRLVSRQLARELHCYPAGRERDILTVAMVDPQDKQAIERLQRETGLRIFPVLTDPQELRQALENWP